MVFATVSDLVSRWKELDEDERVQAATLLKDASSILEAYCLSEGIEIPARCESTLPRGKEGILLDNLRIVCCSMVRRVMEESEKPGVTQETETAGVYSHSYTYVSSTGSMYLTAVEKSILGIGRGRVYSIYPSIGGDYRGVCYGNGDSSSSD